MVESTQPTRIPRACSDVFRLWTSVAAGAVLSLGFGLVIWAVGAISVELGTAGGEVRLEVGLGAQLVAWNAFAISYLAAGLTAFSGCDRAELVRRVRGSPLPASALRRWLLAGGGGQGWAVLIAIGAFASMVSVVVDRSAATTLVLALAGLTVLIALLLIAFSFALHYARHDIERGGLRFSGSEEPVFADYLYMAIGCSATFGTTDTQVTTSAMRRVVTLHSTLGWLLNTVVVAALVSIIVA